ncbi:hypothetical protein BC629DRAFT_945987 [Irpex lacteus]|nr:hypothetical protein BC629DRAFT_945987 [Irpex lacteus]
MVADRLFRVVYVSTNQSEGQIRKILGRCGMIRGVYPWRIGDHRGRTHFFVEFDSSEEVKRVRTSKIPSDLLSVRTVADNPQMTANFLSVAPLPFLSETAPMREESSLGNAEVEMSLEDAGLNRISTYSDTNGRRRSSASLRKQSSFSSNSTGVSRGTGGVLHTAGSGYMRLNGDEKENHVVTPTTAQKYKAHMRDFGTPPDTTTPQSDSLFTSGMRNPLSFTDAFSSTTAQEHLILSGPSHASTSCEYPNLSGFHRSLPPRPPPSEVPSLVLHYEGEYFTCELDAITEDPENVIFLLQQTAASAMERDKWMIVAAHYRRKQNLTAAAAVMSSMLDGMSSSICAVLPFHRPTFSVMRSLDVGLKDENLGPAYLMLAGCYNDLRRRTQEESDADTDKAYLEKAQECLRKVYGTGEQVLSSVQAPILLASSTDSSRGRGRKRKGSSDTSVDETDLRQAEKKLQRELQSLRDRHANNVTNLTEARRAKRKLEDELDRERAVRKKIETEFEEKKEELDSVRRSEEFALDLCKREVVSRRKAEEEAAEAAELREKVKRLRQDLDEKERRIRELDAKEQQKREVIARAGAMLMESAGLDVENLMQLNPIKARTAVVSPSRSTYMGPPGLSSRRERTVSASSSRGYRERDRSSPMGMR